MKLLELIKLLPKGLENPKQVIEGFMNNIKLEHGSLPEDQAEEILRRRLICAGCQFMSENAKLLSDFKTSRTDPFCVLCSCPISSKTASLDSSCGAKHWNEKHPNHTSLEVKWETYGKEDKQEGLDSNAGKH